MWLHTTPRYLKCAYAGMLVFTLAGCLVYLSALWFSTAVLVEFLDFALPVSKGQLNAINVSHVYSSDATPLRAVFLYAALAYPVLILWICFSSLARKDARELFRRHMGVLVKRHDSEYVFRLKMSVIVLFNCTVSLSASVVMLYLEPFFSPVSKIARACCSPGFFSVSVTLTVFSLFGFVFCAGLIGIYMCTRRSLA